MLQTMTKKTTQFKIPSDDVYTYHKQALDMLSKDHPHYEEVRKHLLAQIQDELADRYNGRPNHGTGQLRKITDQTRSEKTA